MEIGDWSSERWGLRLPALSDDLIEALRAQIPEVADLTVGAVVAEVPQYTSAFAAGYRTQLERGVQMAYRGFLGLLVPGQADTQAVSRAKQGASLLGRDEARAHRGIDALLAAYRVGTRVHWERLSRLAVEHNTPAVDVAALAGVLLAYNHELSAASVAGHQAERAAQARERELDRERLAAALIAGRPAEELLARAKRASWEPPESLVAVLVPDDRTQPLTSAVPGCLVLLAAATEPPLDHNEAVVLVPASGRDRSALLRRLADTPAIVGPARPWASVAASYRRARRALDLPRPSGTGPDDTEAHLTDLVVMADPEALADLRAHVLAPLADLPPDTVERLAATLRSWLLHQGRRDDVARDLNIHPQTVRYRMDQIRPRYPDALRDPEQVRQLAVALATPFTVLPEPLTLSLVEPGLPAVTRRVVPRPTD